MQCDRIGAVLAVIGFVVLGAATVESLCLATERFRYTVDPSIRPAVETIPGEPGEPLRTIVVMVHPDGVAEEFVENEVILKPSSEGELEEFLEKYGGKIVNDGTLPPPPPTIQYERFRRPFQPSGYYTIQVDLDTVNIDDFVQLIEQLNLTGNFAFSSMSAVKLIALLAQEVLARRTIQTNNLVAPQSSQCDCVISSTQEYAKYSSVPDPNYANEGFADGFEFLWDANIQITQAWQYIHLLGLCKWSIPLVTLAVIDNGFNVNEDFRGYPQMMGFDYVYHDYDVSGKSPFDDAWHGTKAFSIAGALIDNRFGSAGTGGQVVSPVFFRTEIVSHTANAIHDAAVNFNADVISASIGHFGVFTNVLKDALKTAYSMGSIVVAGAGNEDVDLDSKGKDYLPCEAPWVVCVGAMDCLTEKAVREETGGLSWGSNYGSNVDVWGPGYPLFHTTPTPESIDEGAFYSTFGMTSAATAYVAGVISLMKAVNPVLDHDKVLGILQQTANANSDPARMKSGYLNAFEAVKKAADLGGLSLIKDSFEVNNSINKAYEVTLGKVTIGEEYTSTITPGDADYFSFIPGDYSGIELSVCPSNSQAALELEIYDKSGNQLKSKGGKMWSPVYFRLVTKERVDSLPDPSQPYYAKVYGKTKDDFTCYRFHLMGTMIKPDCFDDGVYPDGTTGEPRNDSLEDRAVIPGVIDARSVPPSPFTKYGWTDISDLNFDVPNDIDFFEVTLGAGTNEKTGRSECLKPGTDPYGKPGFFQGHLTISVVPGSLGVATPFKVQVYDAYDNPIGYTNNSGLGLSIECPHELSKDGIIRFSVSAEDGKRNFYSIHLSYMRWGQTRQVFPDWLQHKLLPDPPLLWIPPPPFRDPITRVFPSKQELIERVFAGNAPDPLPAEYAVFAWEKLQDLDVYLSTKHDRCLTMTLYDAEHNVLASTTAGAKDDEYGLAVAGSEEHMHAPALPPGTYVLAFGPGDFATAYSVRFASGRPPADDFEHGVTLDAVPICQPGLSHKLNVRWTTGESAFDSLVLELRLPDGTTEKITLQEPDGLMTFDVHLPAGGTVSVTLRAATPGRAAAFSKSVFLAPCQGE